MLFIAFFVMNGFSVVLGDKEHHQMSLHLMQLCYFSVFYCINYVDEIVLKAYCSFRGLRYSSFKERRPVYIRFLLCTLFAL